MTAHLAAVRSHTAAELAPATARRHVHALPSPAELRTAMPLDPARAERIRAQRGAIRAVLAGTDPRPLAIVGPCSLHDPEAAFDYGQRLAAVADRLADDVLIVMRAYVEKPRTTVGWKGLLHDPSLDGGNDLARGLRVSRDLLMELAGLGLPLATELLSPVAADYLEDCLAWAAIGARTTESQTHRELVSGLDLPVGFKNGTDGDLGAARDAMQAAACPHARFGSDADGRPAWIETAGNPDTHLILRGGRGGANCDATGVAAARSMLAAAGLVPGVVVDCSHANSGKDPARQPAVLDEVIAQRRADPAAIAGVMLESHLRPGRQDLDAPLTYGVSVTDGCLGWADTEAALERLAAG